MDAFHGLKKLTMASLITFENAAASMVTPPTFLDYSRTLTLTTPTVFKNIRNFVLSDSLSNHQFQQVESNFGQSDSWFFNCSASAIINHPKRKSLEKNVLVFCQISANQRHRTASTSSATYTILSTIILNVFSVRYCWHWEEMKLEYFVTICCSFSVTIFKLSVIKLVFPTSLLIVFSRTWFFFLLLSSYIFKAVWGDQTRSLAGSLYRYLIGVKCLCVRRLGADIPAAEGKRFEDGV